MFARKLFASLFVLGLIASTAQATTYDMYQLGPFTVTRYGATEEIAAAHAQDAMEEIIDDIIDNLPPGHFFMGAPLQREWDGFAYTITFTVFISEGT